MHGALLMVFHRNYHCIFASVRWNVHFHSDSIRKGLISSPKEIKLSLPALEQWTDHSWEPSAQVRGGGAGKRKEKADLPSPQENTLP